MLVSRFVRYAPKGARFLLTALSDNLPAARRLVLSAPLSATDAGDGGDYTVSISGASASDRGVVKLAGQLGGTADAPDVRGLRVLDNSAPELLTLGEVQNGEVLARSGAAIVGVAAVLKTGDSMSGNLAMGGNKVTGLPNATGSGDAVPFGQVTALLNGLDWQQSVLDKDLATPPGSPANGERYLVAPSATGAWSGHSGQITEWNGTAWFFTTPNKGFTVHTEDEGVDYCFNGTNWVSLGASIDHAALLNLAAGDPHTQYQLHSQRNVANGYAGVDGGGRVGPAQAPPKSVYSTGGDQPLTPSDIGAVASSRNVSTGVGLSGGGSLTQDRTLAIAAFTGLLSKDHDPAQADWAANEVKIHLTLDIGLDGQIIPVGVRLPPAVNAALATELVLEFHNSSTAVLTNTNTSSPLTATMQDLAELLMGDLNTAAQNNGLSVRKIKFQTRNTTGSAVNAVDIGLFRVRGYTSPKGSGAGL